MITLYHSGSYFGMPDPSPFCIKTMTDFRMAGISYESKRMSFGEAPKGKVPYIREGDLLLGDSFFIRRHLEAKHGADFSGGCSQRDLAVGWALERMAEEHVYLLIVYDRWMNETNFDKGPRQFFLMAPAPVRPLVRWMVRGKVRKMLMAEGLGRHTDAERLELGVGDARAIETVLGDKPFLLGERPCGADSTVFAMLWSAAVPLFESGLGTYIRNRPKLMGYMSRMRERFFPEFAS
jgi:glutathione S-transferase